MNMKTVSRYMFLFLLVHISLIIVFLSGCAKEHKFKPIHFKPAPPPEIPAHELPPVPTASPVQAIRVANAYFIEAQTALQKGDRKTAQEKYLTVRRTLISAGIVPYIFKELNEFWEKEILPESEKKISLESMNTYKIIERLKGSSQYSSIVLHFPVQERILYEIEDAQNRYPDRFQEGLDRSGYYVEHLRKAFKEAGLPQELCWLAMVESMYKLKAYSSSGAAGMWQFIRSTGGHYRMQMNSYVDERYNWVLATSRAIEYLKHLHDFFGGSWELAISAYNMGEGALIRTIEATGGERDFWTLIETPPASYRIKDETKKYLPRFLAYILICNDPVPYGFSPSPYKPVQWDEIEVQGMYALDSLDKAMGYSVGTLSSWNPFLIRGITPPNGCKLMVPAGDGVKLASILSTPTVKQAEVLTHIVKKNESAYQIARRYGVSVDELLKLNQLNSVKSIKPGMQIQIPSRKEGHISFAKSVSKQESGAQEKDFHIVQRGETLYLIGKKYGIEVEDLARWNNINGSQMLKVGDRIVIKPTSQSNVEPISIASEKVGNEKRVETQTKDIYHTVKAGETISSIAKLYSVSPKKIMEMNNLSSKSILHIGQKLIIRQEVITVAKNEQTSGDKNVQMESKGGPNISNDRVHIVQKGDTLGKIASLYNVSVNELKQWNGLDDNSVLKIGQKIYLEKSREKVVRNEGIKSLGDMYIVKPGDTLSKIAKENNTSVKTIMELNNLKENMVLKVGQTIILSKNISDKGSSSSEQISTETVVKNNAVFSAEPIIYRVQPGDNLWAIARNNKVSVSQLAEWNNLDISKQLKVGQEIKIYQSDMQKEETKKGEIQISELLKSDKEKPQTLQTKEEKRSEVNTYIVQKGDSLYSISKKVGIPLEQLMEINNFNENKVLQVGETVIIKK